MLSTAVVQQDDVEDGCGGSVPPGGRRHTGGSTRGAASLSQGKPSGATLTYFNSTIHSMVYSMIHMEVSRR